MKSFASDNYSGIHPEIFKAIQRANNLHEISYGDDTFTAEANQLFEKEFGKVTVLYTFNGTGANVTCLKCCTLPFQAVVCSEFAHILADECGAPTQSIGCSLLPLKTADGKLTPEMIKPLLGRIGNVHNTQPRVISISQSTELGTVYSIAELKALCDFAHANGMYVHLDGARISNAVAALGVSMKAATVDCGVDIMSFGGTKNGLMMGEAVLIFNEELKTNAPYFHKQIAQLFSKNRFIATQFTALLTDNLWLRMATHANQMAQLLAKEVNGLPGVKINRSVDANAVFVIIPEKVIQPLRAQYPFYEWDAETHEQRWMCSFDTTEEEVIGFVKALRELL
ncbi:MAG: aminotransferase class V-fold PLP-dependent enzyme [Paludibacter sp.]|nr:aminotransferase class V-fold PLP-dependent enzyme [Paludibacter sp.]